MLNEITQAIAGLAENRDDWIEEYAEFPESSISCEWAASEWNEMAAAAVVQVIRDNRDRIAQAIGDSASRFIRTEGAPDIDVAAADAVIELIGGDDD